MSPNNQTIEDLVKNMGVTYKEFARRFGIPYRTIKYWKNNSSWHEDTILALLGKCISENIAIDPGMKDTFPENLKNYLSATNMTQAQFRRQYYVSERSLREWMSGQRKPPQYFQNILCSVLAYDLKNRSDSDEKSEIAEKQADTGSF